MTLGRIILDSISFDLTHLLNLYCGKSIGLNDIKNKNIYHYLVKVSLREDFVPILLADLKQATNLFYSDRKACQNGSDTKVNRLWHCTINK